MSGDQLYTRTAWLGHLHTCPECGPDHLCPDGTDRLDAMRAGMSAEETWLAPACCGGQACTCPPGCHCPCPDCHCETLGPW